MKKLGFTLVAYTSDRWEHVCPIIRIIAPAEQAGIRLIRGTVWENNAMQVFPERLLESDIVLIQRDFPSRVAEYEEVMDQARSRGKFVVYELDDLLPELPEQHPDFEHYRPSRAGIIRAILEADAVVGSTQAICDYSRQFNQKVFEFPNCLYDQLWNPEAIAEENSNLAVENQETPLVLGYMGGHSHSYDLEIVTLPLIRILQKYPNQVVLKFWGLEPPIAFRNWPNVEWVKVEMLDYREFVAYFLKQKCDIFLAPLQDNLFNHSKSHLKFLEYSALGVPGVYSRITPYQRVVTQRENGFLALKPAEWEEYIIQLIENPTFRTKMGIEAQSFVRTRWMLSKHITLWKEIYESFGSSSDRPRAQVDQIPLVAKNATRKLQSFQTDLEKRLAPQEATKKRFIEALSQTQGRAEVLRNQLVERDRSALDAEKVAQQYYRLYQDVLNTNSWKILERVAKVRSKLIPRGSRREGLLRLTLHSLSSFREEGIHASLRVVKNGANALFKRALSPQATFAIHQQHRLKPDLLFPPVLAVDRCRFPAISLLVLKGAVMAESVLGEAEGIETQDVLEWVRRQTYPSIANVVVWDRAAQFAWIFDSRTELDQPEELWRAPDIKALCQNLDTRYICFVSSNLLQQDATYLETNLIALETESLALTVNLRGDADWALRHLEQGQLPGSKALPMFHQVVLKECIRDDFSLDLSPWLEKWQRYSETTNKTADPGFPVVAGKIILHTTSRNDEEDSFPFAGRLFNPFPESPTKGFAVQGRNILVGWREGLFQESFSHPVLSIGDLIPAKPDLSDLPTVIVVMPFLAVGGAEQVALKVMQQLKEQIRFAVMTFEAQDPALGTTADAFRQITPFVYTIPDFAPETQYASFMTFLIERLRPHTIYIANGTTWIYNALGSVKERYPDLRIVDQVYDAQVGWINRYDLPVVLYTDGHIGVNSKICQAYIQKGVNPEQVYLIENGVDSQDLNPADYPENQILKLKEKLGLNPKSRVVTFASRLHPQKRPMDFIELARRFSTDPTVNFLMVGDGPLAAQVKGQIQKIGLSNVRYHEFYHPISDILAISDVLVLPSEFEGMPMIVIEAQAMGKPVVVTDVGNNREVIERTRGGIVVPRIGDIFGLIQAVKEMLNTPPDPHQLRRLTLSHFDIQLVAQKYRKALLGDHNGG